MSNSEIDTKEYNKAQRWRNMPKVLNTNSIFLIFLSNVVKMHDFHKIDYYLLLLFDLVICKNKVPMFLRLNFLAMMNISETDSWFKVPLSLVQ